MKPKAAGANEGERLDNDPNVIRYGCFLPDLTGLARHSSAASLSAAYINHESLARKAATA